MTKIQHIRDMKEGELEKFIEEKKSQGVTLRFDIAAKQIKNHREYRQTKKDIAKALTVIKENELNN
jgi:ribosomal protein L29